MKAKPREERRFIEHDEVLNFLEVSPQTLFIWIKLELIPYVVAGRDRLLFHWPSVKKAVGRMRRDGKNGRPFKRYKKSKKRIACGQFKNWLEVEMLNADRPIVFPSRPKLGNRKGS